MTMYNHRQKMLLIAFLTLAPAVSSVPATAQNINGLNDNISGAAQPGPPSGEGPSQFLIEPEVQIKGDNIKQKTYRSDPAGQNKNWNLDIGGFQQRIIEDPNQLTDDLEKNNYSGVRLRLPFRGRTGQ